MGYYFGEYFYVTDAVVVSAHNWPSLTTRVLVAQWLEHPTSVRKVVGSNPIWNSEFFSEFSLSTHHSIFIK